LHLTDRFCIVHNMDEPNEMVVQKFPYRCPYCDQPVSYEEFELEEGENFIRCPSCGETYVKMVQA
jgi:DNA-directed RNA polymerase subunit RPC12/RpoP